MRSIRWRLALVYLLLILFAMQVVGLYVFRSLQRYYHSSFAQTLDSHAALLGSFAQRYLPPGSDRAMLHALVSDFARQSGYVVGIFDSRGELVAAASPSSLVSGSASWAAGEGAPRRGEWSARKNEGSTSLSPWNDLDDIRPTSSTSFFDGAQVARSLSGARMGVVRTHPASGERQLHLSLPVPGASGEVAGVVYLVGSLEPTYKTISDVRAILLAATVLAIAVTLGLALTLARTITGPIEAVTRGAARMAEGEFEQEIPVRSDDEVGRLARMFNHLALRLRETLSEVTREREKLSAILTHMADGLVAIDREGRVILINPAAGRILRVKVREQMGRPYRDLLGGLDLDEPVEETLAGRRGISREIQVGDEPARTVKVEFAPLRGELGSPAGAVMLLRDITEEARLEGMRREFIANVSHELKTPLTAVKSYVETLLYYPPDDKDLARKFLTVVNHETDRMTRLVNDLAYLSRLDSEPPSLMRRDRVLLDEVAADVVGKMMVHAENKGLSLRWCPPREGVFVKGDADRLAQVVINLVSNAINFTLPGGEVRVRVTVEGALARLEVEDTGIGIPAEDLPRVFDRFYRVDKARSREQGGSGLGLSIVKQIVLAHGGEVDIKSEVGKGTQVVVAIPVYEE